MERVTESNPLAHGTGNISIKCHGKCHLWVYQRAIWQKLHTAIFKVLIASVKEKNYKRWVTE